MSAITWLHLSDLHFRTTEQHEWDEDIVLRKLLEDVRERMGDGLAPDLILVSGDIAFGGAPEEYALKVTWSLTTNATSTRKALTWLIDGWRCWG